MIMIQMLSFFQRKCFKTGLLTFTFSIQGSIIYESIGLYPAQSFFDVNATTGAVRIVQSLKDDGFARTDYTVRFICYTKIEVDHYI